MISVVIPTLNSGHELPDTLSALMPAVLQGLVARVVIADGGSDDATEAIADETGAEFVRSACGRGTQLSAGAAALKSRQHSEDWLLFLHADTVLQEGWEQEAVTFIQQTEGRTAAYFSFRFDENVWQARVVEAGVLLRCLVLQLPYGDQALLISRGFYDDLSGYSQMPLFEDVDMISRIKQQGALQRLKSIATTSAARYKENGYFPRVIKNFGCLVSYYRGVPPDSILEKYQ